MSEKHILFGRRHCVILKQLGYLKKLRDRVKHRRLYFVYQECVQRWTSLQYHICGVHRWEKDDGLECQCLHPSLTEEEQMRKIWLKNDSPAFRALKGIIMDKTLLRDLRQMSLFKHTGMPFSYFNFFLQF